MHSAKHKLLLIEDNADIAEALQIILTDAGFEHRTLANSANLKACTQDFKPDIIILDALLAGESGGSIASKLQQWEITKNTPIIMVSAHPALEKMAKEAGVTDFLPKPFSISTLLHKIHTHIGS